VTPDARRLAERRDQALRDLAALDGQVTAGELTEVEAEPLRLRYERRAAESIADLARPASEPDHSLPGPDRAPPVPGRCPSEADRGSPEPARRAVDGPAGAPASRRRRRTRLLAGATVAAALVVTAAALAAFVGDRPAGGYATGNVAANSTAPAPAPAAGRDLSKVTDAEMERVVAANPDVPGMRVALADRYAAEGNYDQAVTHYLAVLKRDPGSPDAQAGLAWVMFQTGRPEQALPIVDRALQRAPDLQRALWTKANILLYAGSDPAGAIDLLRRMQREQLTAEVRKQVADLITVAEARRRSGG